MGPLHFTHTFGDGCMIHHQVILDLKAKTKKHVILKGVTKIYLVKKYRFFLLP